MKKRLRKKRIIEDIKKSTTYDDICIKVNNGKTCKNFMKYAYSASCLLNDNRYNNSCHIDKYPNDCPYSKQLGKFAKQEAGETYNYYIKHHNEEDDNE